MSTVIFLNGTSSAGKTTLARALQDVAGQPMLYTGLDVCFGMVPANWGGGRAGPLSAEGFRYHPQRDPTGAPVVTIEHGPVGLRMLRAHQKSAAALAASGFDLVIDEMLLSQQALDGWLATLDGSRTYFVGVHCGLPELERREASRRSPRGLAWGQLRAVHGYGAYDLEVNTDQGDTPESLAATVLRFCQSQRPSAFAHLKTP